MGELLGCSTWILLFVAFIFPDVVWVRTILTVLGCILLIGGVFSGGGGSKYGNDGQN